MLFLYCNVLTNAVSTVFITPFILYSKGTSITKKHVIHEVSFVPAFGRSSTEARAAFLTASSTVSGIPASQLLPNTTTR